MFKLTAPPRHSAGETFSVALPLMEHHFMRQDAAKFHDAMKILVIEDDAQAAAYMVKGLKESGHVVDHAPDGREGLFLSGSEHYDVLIVDRMLPGRDGLSIVEVLRATGNDTPVLFLSALGSVDDRVRGLRAGGDDYLTKPYAFSELLARVEALGRRKTAAAPVTRIQVGGLEMDLLARKVWRDGKAIDLLPREFRLLEYLMRHAGNVVTRTMLLENVWDYHFDPQTNVIDVHIARLRQKIDRDFATPMIQTVRGAGYSLRA
jgi:two-component system OmpR family response regulator